MKTYVRTITFILCKAVHDVFPNGKIKIQFPVSNGYYFNLDINRTVTPEDVQVLRNRMREIIAADETFVHHTCTLEEALEVFRNDESKCSLLNSLQMEQTEYYSLGNYNDYFYGPMMNRGAAFRTGTLLQRPSSASATQGLPYPPRTIYQARQDVWCI